MVASFSVCVLVIPFYKDQQRFKHVVVHVELGGDLREQRPPGVFVISPVVFHLV